VDDVERLRNEVAALRHELKALRRRVTFFDHWHDTVCSPWVKRAGRWFLGFRMHSLGRWYRARWNQSAAKYEDQA